MGVPSKCTIVRAIGRSAFRLEAKIHKRKNYILYPQGNLCPKTRILSVKTQSVPVKPVKTARKASVKI